MKNQTETNEKGFVLFITFRNYLQKEQGLQRVIYRNPEGESVRWSWLLDIVLEKLKENLMVIKSGTISQKTKEKGFMMFITFRNYLKKDKVYKEWILRTGESTKRKCHVISSEILVSKKTRDGLRE